jgi:hypothetical protein
MDLGVPYFQTSPFKWLKAMKARLASWRMVALEGLFKPF